MPRIKLRKKYTLNRLSFGDKLVITLILLFISIIIAFRYISNTVTPTLMNYAEVEARKFINIIINKAINESDIENIESLVIVNEDNGVINTVDFNVNVVNSILAKVGDKVEENMKLLEDGKLTGIPGYSDEDLGRGIIYKLPSGLFLRDNIISNIGPRIPVKIDMRGSLTTNIDTKLTNYGINNALIEISINISLEEQILLPFTTKTIIVENSIPVVLKIIEGTVPKYYSNGINESSPIVSIPLEEN
ncbi:MAG: sporulation protein YunB [Bacilli bacterium]|nr:sporulation protein YunB [Bacilli bacterium]